MKANLILIALLLTVATVTSCNENLVNDNSGDNLQEVENPFIGTWYDVYSDEISGIKVVFTEDTVTVYSRWQGQGYSDLFDERYEYFILPDNEIQFNRNDRYTADGIKHITPYTFSGDTLIIKYFSPSTAAVKYPNYMSPIALLKESK